MTPIVLQHRNEHAVCRCFPRQIASFVISPDDRPNGVVAGAHPQDDPVTLRPLRARARQWIDGGPEMIFESPPYHPPLKAFTSRFRPSPSQAP